MPFLSKGHEGHRVLSSWLRTTGRVGELRGDLGSRVIAGSWRLRARESRCSFGRPLCGALGSKITLVAVERSAVRPRHGLRPGTAGGVVKGSGRRSAAS